MIKLQKLLITAKSKIQFGEWMNLERNLLREAREVISGIYPVRLRWFDPPIITFGPNRHGIRGTIGAKTNVSGSGEEASHQPRQQMAPSPYSVP
jgi:hypothetical protein